MKKVLAFLISFVFIISIFAVSASAYSPEDPLVIVLDPGHGGVDSGAVYPQGSKNPIGAEREINLKIAQGIRSELSKYKDVKVLLTREDNATSKTLTERGYFAGDNKADLLISIHCNSSESTSLRGAEAWYPIDSTWCYYTHTKGAEISTAILGELQKLGIQNRGIKTRVTTKPQTERYQDGSLMDYYTVINSAREKGVTAIIVEHAYINNYYDYYDFLNEDYKLANIARADAAAIANYYHLAPFDWLYLDVNDKNLWYYDAIAYCKENKYMNGYAGTNTFGVTDAIKRQDFVCVLANYCGAELSGYGDKNYFPDVPVGTYYTAAVNWAYENGIVSGYNNGYFGAGDLMAREQLVTMLYNFAKNYLKIDVTADGTKAQSMIDYSGVSDWAKPAIEWAVENGVINGKAGLYIAPLDAAARCEIAAIIKNIDDRGIFK